MLPGGDSAPRNRAAGPDVKADLDAIDWKILKELQADGRMTNVELSRRVGISAPPCLRRIRALEKAGFIKGYHADLDGRSLGFEVTGFVFVGLSSQKDGDLKHFDPDTMTPSFKACAVRIEKIA